MADDQTLSEKIQDLLADHFGPQGWLVTNFYLMGEGIADDGEEFWLEAFTPGAHVRRRLALVEWSRANVQQDARALVEQISRPDDD